MKRICQNPSYTLTNKEVKKYFVFNGDGSPLGSRNIYGILALNFEHSLLDNETFWDKNSLDVLIAHLEKRNKTFSYKTKLDFRIK